jgi:[ribosomal protein S5]-alanine N-acetyltransferase
MNLKKASLKLTAVYTRRLIIRVLNKNDYSAWLESNTNRKSAQNKWDTGPKTKQDCSKKIFSKLLSRLQKLSKEDDYYRFYVFEKRSGKIVGQIDFDIYVRSTHQFANFGYLIDNPYWGMGFGQEAAKTGLKLGFKQLKLNRLEAAINLDNKKSIRLVKAIGMHKEGIKKRYWFENNQWVDHIIYVANPEDIGLKGIKPVVR